MESFLKIVNKSNEEEIFTYEYVIGMNNGALLEQLYGTENNFFCTCNPSKPVEMYIGHKKNYYLQSFRGQKDNHLEGCIFYGNGSINPSDYKTGWNEDENGDIIVELESQTYKEKSQEVTSPTSTGSRSESTAIKKHKLTIREVTKKLLLNAWDQYMHNKGDKKYPNLHIIFDQFVNYQANKTYLNRQKTSSLKSIMYKGGKIGSIHHILDKMKEKTGVFFLLEYVSHEKINEDISNITGRFPSDKADNTVTFTVKNKVLENAQLSNRVSDGPTVITGFVTQKGFKQYHIMSLGILSINTYGVVVESSHERELYDRICQEKRLVKRTYDPKYHPHSWRGLKPDGLFIDTEIPTIIEAFGMSENMDSYHVERDFKLKHFSSLEPNYSFWYWDAYKGDTIPKFPPIKNYN
ncbi:hypothetical protein CN577_25485 [Bacillus toyonensis]|nr:hypothetical protein CN674_20705 [Bacillus toyonensis]PEP03577.1 hypothetical protein CN577_25485 [Bacillus toyonensis]PEU35834.1 hypothetical protein CN537_24260 [Bacillus toyonensis]